MTDNEPSDEISASASQSLPWPDPSRPIVNQQPGYGGPWFQESPDVFDHAGRRRRWPAIVALLVLLVAALVVVWLIWWR